MMRFLFIKNIYAKHMLKKFGMTDCKAFSTHISHVEFFFKDDRIEKANKTNFWSIIENLIFLRNTRLDIAYAVSFVLRYMSEPTVVHLKESKIILWHLKGSIDFGIHYSQIEKMKLFGFSDSDWGINIDDRKSTSENDFSLGLGLITWISRK